MSLPNPRLADQVIAQLAALRQCMGTLAEIAHRREDEAAIAFLKRIVPSCEEVQKAALSVVRSTDVLFNAMFVSMSELLDEASVYPTLHDVVSKLRQEVANSEDTGVMLLEAHLELLQKTDVGDIRLTTTIADWSKALATDVISLFVPFSATISKALGVALPDAASNLSDSLVGPVYVDVLKRAQAQSSAAFAFAKLGILTYAHLASISLKPR